MTAQEIRRAYLDFFKKRGHAEIPRALLVPLNDPTTLFTGSGMQPMIPYLLGEEHPEGKRLVDSQTCIRADDMDEVGDNRHTTFFEMLGNWSLGDYFKTEQVRWMFEFLTEVVGLDPQKLYVTCFIGAPEYDIPKDTEAADIWQKLFAEKNIEAGVADIGSEEDGYKRGIKPGERIFYYDGKKNWWSRNGGPETTPVGDPCGPDSEMFYDFETEHDPKFGPNCHPNCDCGRFLEIGNNVFMAYKKEAEGKFVPLDKPNIDHGSGLERIAAATINDPDVFKISLFWPIIESLEKLSGKKYTDHMESMRVIADHLRAATFLAVDGVAPSNKEQGYVARRMVRRAIRFAFDLGIENDLCAKVVPIIADAYHEDFPEVAAQRDQITDTLNREEKAFRKTLRSGIREFGKLASSKQKLSGSDVFNLYDTHGFPVEMIIEEASKESVVLDENWKNDFEKLLAEQRERSRTASSGTFKGGLADTSVETTKLHTAHHLLLRSLKDVLGDHVVQRGSNITAERLRIDFSNPEKVTREQLDEVEKIVNQKIFEDLPVIRSVMAREDAEKLHAEHEFGAKYPDMVSVYSVGPKDASEAAPKHDQAYSIEFCGGPHVEHTGLLAEDNKQFKITKEEASSAGVRRIKAILQ